ncbi:hypothetical protein NOV72_02445 [Caballeronia novacaledonica]|uniref:Uncharacterized protein n=1 Tax=Caballeronia novacaledonica TaxID=1544861 RepID=A0A2U3I535_9BURK|nr:hypothetical protein [Caballeronia novacaledonica]SPB15219.1 hypothetical protein NOV72_02445 [Caballeronia novacaledonica]
MRTSNRAIATAPREQGSGIDDAALSLDAQARELGQTVRTFQI